MKHLDEEQVQRVLHGELTRPEEASAREHLAGCAPCRERFARAQREENQLHALLSRLDQGAAPRIRAGAVAATALARASSWQRRAAGILVAMGVAGAAYALPGSPIPGWVESVAARIGSLVAPSAPVPAEVPNPAPEVGPDRPGIEPPSVGGVALEPGNTLLIQFTAHQAAGQVRVTLTDDALVLVRAPAGAATFTSEAERLVIDNGGSTAAFEIQIPRLAPRVEIRVAQDRIFLKEGSRVTTEPATASGSYLLPLAP